MTVASAKEHRRAMQAASDDADMYRQLGLTEQQRAAQRVANQHRDRAHEARLAEARTRRG